jgi:hypothetical protein
MGILRKVTPERDVHVVLFTNEDCRFNSVDMNFLFYLCSLPWYYLHVLHTNQTMLVVIEPNYSNISIKHHVRLSGLSCMHLHAQRPPLSHRWLASIEYNI